MGDFTMATGRRSRRDAGRPQPPRRRPCGAAAAPRGTFFLANGDRPVVLLSAGVGITPVLSMLHALAESGSPREIWWLHGARNGSEHPFAAESRELLNLLPDSHCHVFYSRPSAS